VGDSTITSERPTAAFAAFATAPSPRAAGLRADLLPAAFFFAAAWARVFRGAGTASATTASTDASAAGRARFDAVAAAFARGRGAAPSFEAFFISVGAVEVAGMSLGGLVHRVDVERHPRRHVAHQLDADRAHARAGEDLDHALELL